MEGTWIERENKGAWEVICIKPREITHGINGRPKTEPKESTDEAIILPSWNHESFFRPAVYKMA